jgi:hypothetical protein
VTYELIEFGFQVVLWLFGQGSIIVWGLMLCLIVSIAAKAPSQEQRTKSEAGGEEKGRRARRPNPRVVGRDWIN